MTSNNPVRRLITLNDCAAKTSLSRSQLNVYRATGRFPKEVRLGDRRVAFIEDEVDDWIAERIAARDAKRESELA